MVVCETSKTEHSRDVDKMQNRLKLNMAPRTRNSEKRHLRSRKKEVRFSRREVAPRKSAIDIHPPENYENLILYYLTKLKRLFSNPDHPHPQPGNRENSADKMKREHVEKKASVSNSKLEIDHNKYTASHTAPRPRETMDEEVKEKVYNVVNAAIEYGFANNVLERKGDCFVFKNKRNAKIANRQPTPGPGALKRTFCSKCNCVNCKAAFKMGNEPHRECDVSRPVTKNNSVRQHDMRPNSSINNASLHESKTQHSLTGGMRNVNPHVKGQSSRSKSCTVTANNVRDRVKKICKCSKCRAMEQRKKMQRK